MVEDMVDFSQDAVQAEKVGETLRTAREAQGLTIDEIADRTRVPLRYLRAIDDSDYAVLPGKTYAMGFARSYARALGMDDGDMARRLRAEIDTNAFARQPRIDVYAPADPARVSPRWIAWTGGLAAVAIVIGGALYVTQMPDTLPGVTANDVAQPEKPAIGAEAAPATEGVTDRASTAPGVAANAEVAITAKDVVWFRIDDANGKRVHEAELKAGERYVIPTGGAGLTLRTSRPQAMDITVAGRQIATLGAPDTLIKNVALDPNSLIARGTANSGAQSPSAGTTPPLIAPPASSEPAVASPAR